jgi:hypothetical protein
MRLRNLCSKVDATMPSLFTTVDIQVNVNDIKSLSISVDTQEWIPFALMSSNKLFRSVVISANLLRSSCQVPHMVVRF